LDLDVKYSYTIASIQPYNDGVKYSQCKAITIHKTKEIKGKVNGIIINLRLNKQESYISDSQNKLIIFDGIDKKIRFYLRITDDLKILSIINNCEDNTIDYESVFCVILPNNLVAVIFNKNIILGEDTIKSLKEKGMLVYYENVFIDNIKSIKNYRCLFEYNKDNIDLFKESFSGLYNNMFYETNRKLLDNNYQSIYYKL